MPIISGAEHLYLWRGNPGVNCCRKNTVLFNVGCDYSTCDLPIRNSCRRYFHSMSILETIVNDWVILWPILHTFPMYFHFLVMELFETPNLWFDFTRFFVTAKKNPLKKITLHVLFLFTLSAAHVFWTIFFASVYKS